MAKITRNGKAYDSGDVEVFLNGVPLDVDSIVYKNEQDHQLNYGLSNQATSWSRGKVTPTCSIGVAMHNMTPIEIAAQDKGGILNIKPFDLVVTFTNEFNIVVTDRILAKFKDEGREVTGEMGLRTDYELFALSVDLNV